MGYGTRQGSTGGSIRTFWPDDTDTTMFIQTSDCAQPTLADLLQNIYEKWPGASLENITLGTEKIHTDCLGYDLYDAGDYTDFLLITKTNEA